MESARQLTSLNSSALRSIAIISIILHNYLHRLPGAAPENEFAYNIENDNYFLNAIFSSDFLIHFFSYWGHLGVPIFVFLSGYGLALKYNNQSTINHKRFFLSHYKKLFIPLLIGTTIFAVIEMIEGNSFHFFRFVTQSTMLLNLIYPYELNISPIPYWYFGLTIQLYVLYQLLIYRKPFKYVAALTVVSILFMGCLSTHYELLKYSKCNIWGWMIPLSLGVFAARHPSVSLIPSRIRYAIACLVCLIPVLLLCGRSYYLWLLTPAVVLPISFCIVKIVPSTVWKFVKVVGDTSLWILVVHPIVREFFLPLSSYWGSWSVIPYVIITLVLAVLFKKLVSLFPLRKKG